jgi:hypothetical protein
MSQGAIQSAWAERAGGIAGLAFVAANIVAGSVLPKPPKATASAATLSRYLTEHHQRIQAAGALAALGALVFLVFVIGLRDRCADRLGGRLTFAGGLLLVAVAVTGGMALATVAQASDRMSGDAVVAAFAIVDALFFIAPAFATVAFLAGAIRGGADGTLPGWLRGLGGLLAAFAAVAGVSQLLSTSSAASALGFIGFVAFVVWTACASIVMLRSDASAPAAARTAHEIQRTAARG